MDLAVNVSNLRVLKNYEKLLQLAPFFIYDARTTNISTVAKKAEIEDK